MARRAGIMSKRLKMSSARDAEPVLADALLYAFRLMTNINGDDDSSAQLPATPTSPRRHNYFAVPIRGQLAGRSYITTPSHVRSPLAQTPSPVPSDDNILGLGSLSVTHASLSAQVDVANGVVALDDDTPSKPIAELDAGNIVNPSAAEAFTHFPDVVNPPSWSDFLEKYAEGKWSPSRPPPAPVTSLSRSYPPQEESRLASRVPNQKPSSRPSTIHQNASDPEVRKHTRPRLFSNGRAQSSPEPTNISDPQTILQRRGGEQLVLANFEPPTFPDAAQAKWTPAHPRTPPSIAPPQSYRPITPSAVADAATVRWAGARVKVAPLALSSPERR